MKAFFISNFFFLVWFLVAVNGIEPNVYICNSTTAKRYHLKENCRGLKACKTDVKKVTLEDAKDRKRSLCKWED